MKYISKIKYIGVALLVMVSAACEDGFDEKNIDPNSPAEVEARHLFTNAAHNLSYNYWARDWNFELAGLMVQYLAQGEYTEEQRYSFSTSDFDFRWSNLYSGWNTVEPTGGLYDLVLARQQVVATETTPSFTAAIKANQLASIDIMHVFICQMITDFWGDVPMSQAFQPDEFPFPVYDAQSDIYSSMISTVTAAVNSIDTGSPGFSQGDPLFSGDMNDWQQMGNGLLLRLGMRIVDANATLAQSTVVAALGGNVPTTDKMYNFPGGSDYLNNPFYTDRVVDNRDDFRITEELVNAMSANNDPRLAHYAEPAPGGTAIVGLPYGLGDGDSFALKNSTSDLNENIEFNATAPAYLMTVAETELFRAEAIARGWVAGDANTAYQAAITASMTQWGVAAADITTYLAEPGVAYNTTSLATQLESIANQKWVSLFPNGVEAYAEWRRLDIPALVPASAASAQQPTIPMRFLYPNNESGTNGTNLEAVGANLMTTQVWWDVN